MLTATIENINNELFAQLMRNSDAVCAVCLRAIRGREQLSSRACGFCRTVVHIRCTSTMTGRRPSDNGRYLTSCWICKSCVETD